MRKVRLLETLPVAPLAAGLLASLLLTGCGGAAQTGGEQKAPVLPDAQTAATRALEPLRKLVTADNARDMGFEDVSEVANAALGEPIRVQIVRLDALQQFAPGADPGQLLTEANRVIYPVVVRNQVKSSIIVEGSGGQWKFTDFGGPRLVRQVSQFRTDVTERLKPAPDSLTVVHVAALNLYFLGYRVDGRLMLTPIETHAEYKLEAGSSLPADQVFTALAPFAKSYNGLPL
jgi:hypothetical protein